MTEIPAYDSCRENSEFDDGCQVLKPVKTRIGSGYACPECQMTYIQVDNGAFIPFDQALKLAQEKQRRAEERKARANQRMVAKPPKQKKKRKKVRH